MMRNLQRLCHVVFQTEKETVLTDRSSVRSPSRRRTAAPTPQCRRTAESSMRDPTTERLNDRFLDCAAERLRHREPYIVADASGRQQHRELNPYTGPGLQRWADVLLPSLRDGSS
ncbi:hypothetical protein AURDEDRAFT_176956 [Auricularia subglabra TFB-10046 SS5]|uniref:Uncharacterized protein n=1 Tax=Auricularia subglabra (strain TFB-10046 / SS5) TaxID=717982 RepID=J0CUI2_AURST|nr:hypothetical protein AURDEDRAFT_176956 [Auricularia subglabra TFB-10046 SS5]